MPPEGELNQDREQVEGRSLGFKFTTFDPHLPLENPHYQSEYDGKFVFTYNGSFNPT